MRSIIAVLVALSASACSAVPAPAAAQVARAGEDRPTITVGATASASRMPDIAVIQLAVETMATTAAEATRENATRMDAVLRAVRELGVPSSDIQTRQLELHPRYDGPRSPADRMELIGYQAVNQVTVRLDDVTVVGRVVDAAVRAGANRVSGIHFELSDPATAYHEALREAVAKARAEAEVAAAALGRRLGEPLHVSTGQARPVPGPRFEAMAMRSDMAAPPVEPGEVEVQATVSITWLLGS